MILKISLRSKLKPASRQVKSKSGVHAAIRQNGYNPVPFRPDRNTLGRVKTVRILYLNTDILAVDIRVESLLCPIKWHIQC